VSDAEAPPARAATRASPAALRGVRAAFVFLSRIPVGGFPYTAEEQAWAPAYFPLVGCAVGACSALVFSAAHALGPALAAVLAVATSLWVTGAFHEDGLADSADGLGGAHGGKAALEIMKDSRIGTYGACALVLSLLLRSAAIAALAPRDAVAIVVVHCLARVAPVWLLATQPYLTQGAGKGAIMARAGVTQAVVASVWGLASVAAAVELAHLALMPLLGAAGALALLGLYWAGYCKRRVGGINGDLLGALEQLGEIGAWLSLLAIAAL
jgi:adenosylcobinamide-GDP ribazoletransferase